MIRKYFLLILLTAGSLVSYPQKSYNEQVLAYIEQFKDVAIAEQKRTGVPASIKLAQGIYETGAGSSELCNNASNHFGIKCKNTWNGETYTYTDDAKDECFRKYASALQSYKDHSDFLKDNKRYASLFSLSPTDYAAWAYGLKRCGYATNPQYARKIIKTIEDFHLQEYTYAALDNKEEEVLLASASRTPLPKTMAASSVIPGENIPDNDGYDTKKAAVTEEIVEENIIVERAPQEKQSESGVTDYYQNTRKNGMKGFYARKGDMLLEYAIKNKIRYARILELNDLPDAPLEADMFIYLEKKAKTGTSPTHKVEDGETLLQISQQEGMQLQQLRLYNHLARNEEPAPGTILSLQSAADSKPETYLASGKTATSAAAIPVPAKEDTYVATNRATRAKAAAAEEIETEVEAPFNERVNIADEKPVEETIAEERSQAKPAANASPLDKLKAHMDKTVYANEKKFEPKSSGNYEEENTSEDQEEITTVPARKAVAVQKKNAPAPQKQQKETPKAKAKTKARTHTVKKGESLFSIAQKYDLTVSQLQKMNKLGSKKIQPGAKLKVVK
jgi:LysM repeat protein